MSNNNQTTATLIQKYQELKNEIQEKIRGKSGTFLNLIIPGKLEKTGADSRRHKTDIKIKIENEKVSATVAEYEAENIQENFPFKMGYCYLLRIIEELEKAKFLLT